MRPSRFALVAPRLGGTSSRSLLRSRPSRSAATAGRGLALRVALPALPRKRTDLPSSWGTFAYAPRSQTPVEPQRSDPLARAGMLPSVVPTTSASTTNSISGLNHAARTLAVYASRQGSLPTRARLAPGWRVCLGRTGFPPARFLREVSEFCFFLPPLPDFSWRKGTGTGILAAASAQAPVMSMGPSTPRTEHPDIARATLGPSPSVQSTPSNSATRLTGDPNHQENPNPHFEALMRFAARSKARASIVLHRQRVRRIR